MGGAHRLAPVRNGSLQVACPTRTSARSVLVQTGGRGRTVAEQQRLSELLAVGLERLRQAQAPRLAALASGGQMSVYTDHAEDDEADA
jgi:hypothetical protein